MAVGELGVGALRSAVGHLNRPEQLLLELVGGVLIETLVGLAQGREREPDLISCVCDGIEQLLAGFRGGVCHGR